MGHRAWGRGIEVGRRNAESGNKEVEKLRRWEGKNGIGKSEGRCRKAESEKVGG
jgi:hypothetical protein